MSFLSKMYLFSVYLQILGVVIVAIGLIGLILSNARLREVKERGIVDYALSTADKAGGSVTFFFKSGYYGPALLEGYELKWTDKGLGFNVGPLDGPDQTLLDFSSHSQEGK